MPQESRSTPQSWPRHIHKDGKPRMVSRGPCITGAALRASRVSAGLTQAALAALAGFHRGAVWYWERKAVVPLREVAPRRFAEALGMLDNWTPNARAQSWGVMPDAMQDRLDARADLDRIRVKEAERQANARVICRAKTRAGHPCGQKSEAGKRRCKWHGGRSTGPKTTEGKARIAEAQRRRWAKCRRVPTSEA